VQDIKVPVAEVLKAKVMMVVHGALVVVMAVAAVQVVLEEMDLVAPAEQVEIQKLPLLTAILILVVVQVLAAAVQDQLVTVVVLEPVAVLTALVDK
jgi:hypothetical protein